MTNESVSKTVLVTGDVVWDHYLYEGLQRRPGSTIRLGTVQSKIPGGAALLCELLKAVGGLSVDFGLDVNAMTESIPHGYCLMRPHPQVERDKKNRVWRVEQALGYDGASAKLDAKHINRASLEADHNVVVIDDAGLEFRRWPSREAWPRFLLDGKHPEPSWLVLKLSSPVAAGDLWHTLVSGQTQDIEPQPVREAAQLLERTVAIISINDLRVEPIHVTKALSWERAALDLAQELCENEQLAPLRKLRCVVISLDTDGALIADFPAGGEPRFRLVFDPARLESDFNAAIPGAVFGSQTCLTAAIVKHLAKSASPTDAISTLGRGVQAGLCAMRRSLKDGHGTVSDTPVEAAPGFPTATVAREILLDEHEWLYGTATVPAPARDNANWTIVAGPASTEGTTPLWGLARRVAMHGTKQLQQTPYLQYGKLFSIERTEIESLRSLRRLLLEYQRDRKAEKPLSIAAFGPPGSGKSFSVKELSKAMLDEEVPLLEFNLSQFASAAELNGLFHQVRDKVLAGKLPVVFWDEFDSQDLKWLQLLLAPMHDGKFQEGQVTHPIGKCLFVFAGGTRERFEDFGEPPAEILRRGGEAVDDWNNEFRMKKGPDFKSRLAGYINVLGPNPRDEHDITFPVRRALLLRVHLGIDPEARLAIDPGLLAALLEIDKYRHGARSLEKIAEQIRHSSRTGEFGRSDLPARNLLNLHVDAERFLALSESHV